MHRSALPAPLITSLQPIEGFDERAFIEVHERGDQVTSVRINRSKIDSIAGHFPGASPVPWSNNGFYLPTRPAFVFDPWLHGGAYYVQEASGMFLEYCLKTVMNLDQPIKVLDLCAAPGGKSTLIQSIISSDSLLVSNEVIKTRVPVLRENLVKWGSLNKVITSNDPKDFARLENFFDVIVVDAPCSGSGLFRRDPQAIEEWSPRAVEMCNHRQQRILADVYPSLKANGILIYSTCSYSPEEDEDICDWVCDTLPATPLDLNPEKQWHITETASRKHRVPGYRFFPYQVKGEGFFLSCFRKGDTEGNTPVVRKNAIAPLPSRQRDLLKPWICGEEDIEFFEVRDEVIAFPASSAGALQWLSQHLYLRNAGVLCGKIMRTALMPEHELAVSPLLAKEVAGFSVSAGQALNYLRKQDLVLDSAYRGWATVRYENISLGWIKMLGNRINNYYPKEWRILKSGNS